METIKQILEGSTGITLVRGWSPKNICECCGKGGSQPDNRVFTCDALQENGEKYRLKLCSSCIVKHDESFPQEEGVK